MFTILIMINPKTIAILKLSGFKPAAALRWEKGTTTIAVHESRFVVIYMHNPEGQRKQFHESTPDRINRDLQKFLKAKYGVEIPKLSENMSSQLRAVVNRDIYYPHSTVTLTALEKRELVEYRNGQWFETKKGAIIAEMLKADTHTPENY